LGAQSCLQLYIEEIDPEKPSFRPSKWPQKLKLLKIVNCQNCQKTVLSQLEKVGGHRYPYGPHAGQKDTIRMNVQHWRSTWQQEYQICYQQEDYGVKSVRNRAMIHITAQ
jgi:hypothetical protein